ncbi:hypothetical protein JO972_16755 [Verrucomicrobiaceae bacterium 5K15]|uniref:Uncharacterized protein n=1 Tax=Oceaniferula flava TaxID=2800421 RepID=A0AAE2V977_9BACT|nr:hypothetical protein [Oceaniferula flavus]MBK1856617.1 hypothetical protein [Oceaniferula flavus]MBM1137925.1 hypothetical protein [Oceaniferula flavus]
MKSRIGLPIFLLCAGFLMFFVPSLVEGSQDRIIEWLAPGDPIPQTAMAIYGMMLLASRVCIPLGIAFLVFGVIRLIKVSSEGYK